MMWATSRGDRRRTEHEDHENEPGRSDPVVLCPVRRSLASLSDDPLREYAAAVAAQPRS